MKVTIETTVQVDVTLTIEVDADYVDNGIGGYEYWGAKGYHEDWGWALADYAKPEVVSATLGSGEAIELPSKFLKDIEAEIDEAVEAELKELPAPEPDYDYD